MKKTVEFEYYVLNGTNFFNRDSKECRVVPYNIFNNFYVNKETNKLCKRYKKEKMSFDEFVSKLDNIIRYEEWARCEYEICVADWPLVWRGKDNKIIHVYYGQEHEPIESLDTWKIDCYEQAHMNIRLIAKYVLEEYYPKMKIKLTPDEEELRIREYDNESKKSDT